MGVLDKATRAWLGARARLVRLPARAMRKQQKRHPDLGIADYRRLPDVLGKPDFVLRRMPANPIPEKVLGHRLNLVREVAGEIRHAVIQRSPDGLGVRMVSYYGITRAYLNLLLQEAKSTGAIFRTRRD